MTRVAILGGGISGLTAAYELELARKRGAPIDWHLYEATDRLGGIIETTRITTPDGTYILEGGPDGWVSEKPWARELAIELGLEADLIYSNDATRKTYILIDHKLIPIPDRMRLMVPEDLSALDNSPLFSESAKRAYHRELARSAELKASVPSQDESVASFIRRHFGQEALEKIGAPLLSGVFGGDIALLSVRAVMPQFVAMEREHGSLIAAIQRHAQERTTAPQPIFTSLRNGMASVVAAIVAALPPDRLHTARHVSIVTQQSEGWHLEFKTEPNHELSAHLFDHVFVAASVDETRRLLTPISAEAAALLPVDASSATLVTVCWPQKMLSGRALHQITVPQGFGFLTSPQNSIQSTARIRLLACTFVDQKFPHRAPAGARILRAFFGDHTTDHFADASNEEIANFALAELRTIMGPLPDPVRELIAVRRLPRSLPQYEVGHLDRIAQLEELVARIPGLHLLGNPYCGVGLPDLIRDARATARRIASVN
jgi:oxygen-dependent protoporphyrinogen oxidase